MFVVLVMRGSSGFQTFYDISPAASLRSGSKADSGPLSRHFLKIPVAVRLTFRFWNIHELDSWRSSRGLVEPALDCLSRFGDAERPKKNSFGGDRTELAIMYALLDIRAACKGRRSCSRTDAALTAAFFFNHPSGSRPCAQICQRLYVERMSSNNVVHCPESSPPAIDLAAFYLGPRPPPCIMVAFISWKRSPNRVWPFMYLSTQRKTQPSSLEMSDLVVKSLTQSSKQRCTRFE